EPQAFDPPPRMRSANANGGAANGAHKHVIAGALAPTVAHAVGTRSKPRRNAFEAAADVRRAPSKTVHWFDGPRPPITDGRSPDHACDPGNLPPPPPSASAKSSADFGAKPSADFGAMSIVLRSPAAATRNVASPVALRPTLPIAANASVTAVGGRRQCVVLPSSSAPASAPLTPLLFATAAPLPRRAHSVPSRRVSEPAPPSVRRSRSADLARQATPPASSATHGSSTHAAGHRVRRARSLVLGTRPAGRHARMRCATVVPVRLELQRLLRTTRAHHRPATATPAAPAEPSRTLRQQTPSPSPPAAPGTRMSAPPAQRLP
ncbi:hypothetical protein LPJ73_009217, partial [Coemansia sp. RSA 2703]